MTNGRREKMKTFKSITNSEISRLRAEAVVAGDYIQIAICDLALNGGEIDCDDYAAINPRDFRRRLSGMTQDEAVAICVDVINEAAAQAE